MGRKEIEKAVETLLEPCLEKEGIELVDVEYVRERDWISASSSTKRAVWI